MNSIFTKHLLYRFKNKLSISLVIFSLFTIFLFLNDSKASTPSDSKVKNKLFVNGPGAGKHTQEGLKPQLKGDGKYGMAGCGFGSMVFEANENNLFSMTLNHITSSQAFGISTGTSNCHHNITLMINQAQSLPEYIEINKDRISIEAATGQGDTIKSLSIIMDCKETEVSQVLKENYKKIFVDTKMQSAAIEANLNNLILDNQKCF